MKSGTPSYTENLSIPPILKLLNVPLRLALRACKWIALISVTLMSLVATTQVLSRMIPGMDPFSWTEEASLFLMVYMTFAVLPIASYRHLHTILDMLLDRMGAFKFPTQVFINLCCLITSLSCIYYGFIFYKAGSGTMATTLDWIDRGWVYLAIPTSFILMSLVYLHHLLAMFVRRGINNKGQTESLDVFDAAIHIEHL
jgi:TRAP-type C4-dicarboxylate transport system permease small subunit